MKIICSNNIFSNQVNDYICNLLDLRDDYLYLTGIPEISEERKKSKILEGVFKDNSNILYFNSFLKYCSNEVYNTKNYLPNVDLRYIIRIIIENYFDNFETKAAFKNIQYQLFILYRFLMMNGVNGISNHTLEMIRKNNSQTEFYIFDIYNELIKNVNEIVDCFSKGESVTSNKLLDFTVISKNEFDENFDTFINLYRNQIYKNLSKINMLVLDGFFYFSEEINFLVKCCLELNKEIVLITKNINEDSNAHFLIDEILNKCKISRDQIEYVNFKNEETKSSGLYYLKTHFYDNHNLDLEKNNKFFDGSVNIVKPFLNRHKEIEFIAKEISEIIQSTKSDNIEELKNIIKNDIVIVTAVNYNQTSEEIDNAFKKYGLFVRNNYDIKKVLGKEIDINNIKEIYYNSDDFLSLDVFYNDGAPLSIDEKILYFSKCYDRITLKRDIKPFIISPVLEYVFQIYEIFKKGISVKRLKLLLFSNWYYHTGKSKVKWDKYIGTLNQIEPFLDHGLLMDGWIMQLEDILKNKREISQNILYKNHPFNSISNEEVEFLLSLLKDINRIVDSLSRLNGDIQCHLDFLKENIINSQDLFLNTKKAELSEEQKSVKKFCSYIKDIISDSTIKNIDTGYFWDYLKSVFYNIDSEDKEPSETPSKFKLKLCNMLNFKRFKYTFFVGCESGSYPRKNIISFPFTRSISEILSSSEYGINITNLDIKSEELNLNLEKYLFKNTIDFTTEKIYYTSTKNSEKGDSNFSIYINDIFETFNQDIVYNYKNNEIPYIENKIIHRAPQYISPKNQYSLKELITFCLCPKLYYHLYFNDEKIAYIDKGQLKLYAQSILYSELLDRFMKYNKENKKWYFYGDKEVYEVLDGLIEEVSKEHFKYFDCLSIPDLLNAKKRARLRVEKIIEDYIIKKLKYYKYTIVPSEGKLYSCGKYDVILEYDTAIFTDKRGSRKIDQNKIFLDFLTLKCTDRDVKEKHYKDMIELMKKKNKFTDRAFFANRMISKINVQFDSNNDRFINGYDGAVERVNNIYNNILNTDFSNISSYPSNYCDYCIVKNVCMGGRESKRNWESTK